LEEKRAGFYSSSIKLGSFQYQYNLIPADTQRLGLT
jgi:hypothetical protein